MKRGRRKKRGGGVGALNLWLTESCEGTLNSPKSFKLEHVALARVTLMRGRFTVELEVREENKTVSVGDHCGQNTASHKAAEETAPAKQSGVVSKKRTQTVIW